MVRVAAIVLAILTGCDYVAFDGQYTHGVLQVLTAIKHAFV
jgi:predicted aminopeptidase